MRVLIAAFTVLCSVCPSEDFIYIILLNSPSSLRGSGFLLVTLMLQMKEQKLIPRVSSLFQAVQSVSRARRIYTRIADAGVRAFQ